MSIVKFLKDSQLQSIKANWIDDTFKLSPTEEAIKKRLLHFQMLVFENRYSKHQAIQIHCREMGVSKATAYRDAQQAEYILGDVYKVDKEFQRALLMEAYWTGYQRALKKGDMNAEIKYLEAYERVADLHTEAQSVNPEKLAASNYYVKLHAAAKKMMKQAFDSGVMDMNQVDVEDVDFKEVEEKSEDDD